MTGLYFEDLKISDRFLSDTYEVTEEKIIAFAREFDVQDFHLDHAAAEKSLFEGLAASGWHTAAIAMRLFTTRMRFVGGAIGLAVDELRWPIAVRPNDTLQVETEILKARVSKSKPGYGIIRIRNIARNQRGEIALSYEANALVGCRPNE